MCLQCLLFQVGILIFGDMSQSTCQFLQVLLVVGDLPLFQIGHEALHQDRPQDRSQALRLVKPVLLSVQLPMTVALSASQMTQSETMMTLPSLVIANCTMILMQPLHGHFYLFTVFFGHYLLICLICMYYCPIDLCIILPHSGFGLYLDIAS